MKGTDIFKANLSCHVEAQSPIGWNVDKVEPSVISMNILMYRQQTFSVLTAPGVPENETLYRLCGVKTVMGL